MFEWKLRLTCAEFEFVTVGHISRGRIDALNKEYMCVLQLLYLKKIFSPSRVCKLKNDKIEKKSQSPNSIERTHHAALNALALHH